MAAYTDLLLVGLCPMAPLWPDRRLEGCSGRDSSTEQVRQTCRAGLKCWQLHTTLWGLHKIAALSPACGLDKHCHAWDLASSCLGAVQFTPGHCVQAALGFKICTRTCVLCCLHQVLVQGGSRGLLTLPAAGQSIQIHGASVASLSPGGRAREQ